jgi:hypothetical protein
MNPQNIVVATLALTLTACPDPLPSDTGGTDTTDATSGDGDGDTGDGDGEPGTTGDGDGDGDLDTGDGDGDGDGDPAGPVWHVYDGAEFVGVLGTPSADAFTDHSDMFAAGDPDAAYVHSPDGYGFAVNAWDESFVALKHDVVMYTGPDCTGTPVDRFASYAANQDQGLSFEDCDDAMIGPLQPLLILHYGLKEDVAPWVDWRWPGGVGTLLRRDQEPDSVIYKLPIDQPWPSRLDALSEKSIVTGDCTNYAQPQFVCGLELEDYDWMPPQGMGGPYSLVIAP